ncbi:MAG: winged helix-turn-helix transcriptional regulator [Variibacter sp.]|nr:winged helix-turn-helix transcriptional regulator [Variibacter sp.]
MNMEFAVRAAADEASRLLKAMANRHRLMILCRLVEQDRSVGELAALLGIRESTVSQHLAILRRDELAGARRQGQTVFYSISSAPARAIVGVLNQTYCAAPARGGHFEEGPCRP